MQNARRVYILFPLLVIYADSVSACIIAAWPRASIPYPDPFSTNNLIPGPGSEHNKHFTRIPQLRSRLYTLHIWLHYEMFSKA